MVTARETEALQQRQQQVQQEVRAFATDPANVYFNELADDIAMLLKSKVCSSLKEAYDKAVWANPQTRAKEITRLEAEANAKRQREAEDRAAAARKANGANLRTRDRPASPTAAKGTIDDTLTETLAAIQARS